jgi:GTP-binding protein EngB required for normal cell division
MSQSNLTDYRLKLEAYLQQAVELVTQNVGTEQAGKLHSLVSESIAQYKPSLMFYGIYNAGKSSLLNAILGEERASVADKPETKTISVYDWNGYQLVDTPGINANQADTLVTEPELRKHDLVLFVIDDSESFESVLVASEAIKIIRSNKPLIIVINSKQGYENEEEKARLSEVKRKFTYNMQRKADEYGIPNIEKRFDYMHVNAVSALKGKLDNKALLLADSNVNDLETLILQRLKEYEGPKKLRVPSDFILDTLRSLVLSLQSDLQEGDERQLYEFITEVGDRKSTLYRVLNAKIKNMIMQAGEEMYELMSKGHDGIGVHQQLQDRLQATIDDHIKETMSQLNEDILHSRIQLPSSYMEIISSTPSQQQSSLDLDEDDFEQPVSAERHSSIEGISPLTTLTTISPGVISQAAKALPFLAPIISKIPPIAGPIIIIEGIRMLYNLFKTNQEEERRREQMHQRAQALNERQHLELEGRIQSLHDLGTRIRVLMFQTEQKVVEAVEQHIDMLFSSIINKVNEELAEVHQTKDFNKENLNRTHALLSELEKFKLALV